MQVMGYMSKGIDNWGHVSVLVLVFSMSRFCFLINNWYLNMPIKKIIGI